MTRRKDVKFNHRTNGLQRIRSNSDASAFGTVNGANDAGHGAQNGAVMPDVGLTHHVAGLFDHYLQSQLQGSVKIEPSEYEKKKQSFITRTIWTFIMIAGFFGAMFAGHIYMIIIVTAIQIVSFKEVIAIANVPSRARSLRFTKTLNWYFLGTTMYFLYGESVVYYFKHIVLVDRVLLPFATHHRFISFMLYVIGERLHLYIPVQARRSHTQVSSSS